MCYSDYVTPILLSMYYITPAACQIQTMILFVSENLGSAQKNLQSLIFHLLFFWTFSLSSSLWSPLPKPRFFPAVSTLSILPAEEPIKEPCLLIFCYIVLLFALHILLKTYYHENAMKYKLKEHNLCNQTNLGMNPSLLLTNMGDWASYFIHLYNPQ